MFCKKGVFRNSAKFTEKHLVCNFIKKENLAQVLSYKFSEISKNTFSYRTNLVAASDSNKTIAFTKNMNKSIWVVRKSNQLFTRGP